MKHLNLLNNFLTKCTLLENDVEVAQAYGKVKLAVIRKGKPIPENDIWIAAVAMRYGYSLFTTDKHFLQIDGLLLL